MTAERKPQLAYSEIQGTMLDEQHRRMKAQKILSVLRHFLGQQDFDRLLAVDIGCSAGFIADELAATGARTVGLDIDVPALVGARRRFGRRVTFLRAVGERMPFPDKSIDIVIFNHIYEHVVDADAVVADIHRVLKPDGVAYFGLGNKHMIVENHHRLPFLSWLPRRLADRYVRAFGRADEYYEQHRTRAGLARMLADFTVWDYTLPVIRQPGTFHSADQVGGLVSRLPVPLLRAAVPFVPAFIWVASPEPTMPRGPRLGTPPERVGR